MSDKNVKAEELSQEQGFERVPEDYPEAIKTVDGKTQFSINSDDYAVICRGDGTIEQVIPKSLEETGCVTNDIQAFFLFCCLIYTSQDSDPEAKAIVENIYAHTEKMDDDNHITL